MKGKVTVRERWEVTWH